MAKDGSVAPKERVNIRYKPATGDAKEEVELPFKMVVLGDFTQREDDTPLEDRERINVNKDNFNDVLKAQNVKVDLRVADKLTAPAEGEEPGAMDVSLDISSMRDFEPDQLVQKVPQLKKLLELRNALQALKGPMGNVPAFRRSIQSLVDDPAARERLVAELTKKEPGAA